MTNRTRSHYPDIGVLGEDLVAQWLQSTGWIVLHRRWRSRWGEIDIIALQEAGGRGAEVSLEQLSSLRPGIPAPQHFSPLLIFVEVKTRSRGNWDNCGLLSITQRKQAKLCKTAQSFLGNYPNLVDYPCRFDVALVHCKRLPLSQKRELALSSSLPLPQAELILQEYIPSAFDITS